MTTCGLYVRLKAKAGKEAELESFLKAALPAAEAEKDTPVWYAVRFAPGDFAIFDAFNAEAGRQAHINGAIAAALMAKADELLAESPKIEAWDTLAVKLPS